MERTVYALVENDQNQFAVVDNDEGSWSLPTCTVDVGSSFDRAVMLNQVDVRVQPEAFLGFDAATSNTFYLCRARGKAESLLQLHWKSAGEIVALAPQPRFHSVEGFLQGLASTTREPVQPC